MRSPSVLPLLHAISDRVPTATAAAAAATLSCLLVSSCVNSWPSNALCNQDWPSVMLPTIMFCLAGVWGSCSHMCASGELHHAAATLHTALYAAQSRSSLVTSDLPCLLAALCGNMLTAIALTGRAAIRIPAAAVSNTCALRQFVVCTGCLFDPSGTRTAVLTTPWR